MEHGGLDEGSGFEDRLRRIGVLRHQRVAVPWCVRALWQIGDPNRLLPLVSQWRRSLADLRGGLV